jgi:thymidylate synthase (FAD)
MEPELLAGALGRIEYAARVSHRSEENASDSPEKFIRAVVLAHGDWSVTEHVSASVEFLVDRGITHEIVRHRLAAYTQESTRFVNYAKKMPPTFIYPIIGAECERCGKGDEPLLDDHLDIVCHINNGQTSLHNMDCAYDQDWLLAIDECERRYRALLDKGWRPQEARSVFPNALSSKIIVTYNLRVWRHFFLMRTSKEAHPQMRQVVIPLLAEFQRLVPVLYEDIVPESRQVENISKGQ